MWFCVLLQRFYNVFFRSRLMFNSSRPDYTRIDRQRAALRVANLRRWAGTHPFHDLRFDARPLIFGILGILVLLCLGSVVGIVVLDRIYQEQVLPNVTIRGVAVGQMSPDVARRVLEQQYAAFLAAPVTFEFGGRTWRPAPAQLGVSPAIDDAVARAYGLGRGAGLPARMLELAAIWQNGFEVPLHVTIDQAQLQAYLQSLASEIETPPRDATLQVRGGQVFSTPAQEGRQLLVDATVQDATAAMQTLQPQGVPLRTRLLRPAVEDAGIAEARKRLRTLLHDPVTLTAGERAWTWTRADLGTLVRIVPVPRADGSGTRLEAVLDRHTLRQWLSSLAEEIDVAPVEPRLRFNGGALEITQPGRSGKGLQIDRALDQITAALWEGRPTVVLPIATVPPRARPDTLADLGIVELVAQGKSSFANSAPYRVTNIQAGARRMDGVLIAPGEEFSFNETIGAIDAANGFTQGYAIINGRTQLEWGGGVCQVSTTVFRAAFWAGVPITERNQHTYRIQWYEVYEPVGMDAAIFTGPGGYDMRFINDTGHWLLLEASTDTANEVLTINLYGTRPARTVTQVPPRVASTHGGALEVWVGRVVRDASGVVRAEDTFYSYFRPWPAGG